MLSSESRLAMTCNAIVSQDQSELARIFKRSGCGLHAAAIFAFQLSGNFPPPHLHAAFHAHHQHPVHTQATAPSSRNQELVLSFSPVPSLNLLNMASKSDNTENGSGAATPEAAGGYSSLTTREQEILAKAMTCLKTSPEVSICSRVQPKAVTNIPHTCLGFCYCVPQPRLQR